MFISKHEKENLKANIKYMKDAYETLSERFSAQNKVILSLLKTTKQLNERIEKLEGVRTKKLTHQNKWTPERRAEQSDRIKKMWADKREAKSPSNTVTGAPV